MKTVKTSPTIKDIVDYHYDNGSDICSTVNYVKSFLMKSAVRPTRPKLPSKQTSETILEYANILQKYEDDFKNYEILEKESDKVNKEIYETLIDSIKEISDLNNIVPIKYRDKVWEAAWDMGNSSGYSEVYYKLTRLISIFE